MSKEQTPIFEDAEHYLMVTGYPNGENELKECLEQYAQAKVLEALEIVKTLTDNNVVVTSEHIQNLIDNTTKQK